MKIQKPILTFVLVGLISSLLIVPALLPSQIEVKRDILVNTTQAEAYSYLVNLESWKEWSPWLEKEPSAEFSFSGIPGVVGGFTTWKGQEIGEGKQTLVVLEEPEYIETQLEFFSPQKSEAIGFIQIEEKGEQTHLSWGMVAKLDYPLGRIFGLFIESSISPDFEKGLQNLKERLESSSSSL